MRLLLPALCLLGTFLFLAPLHAQPLTVESGVHDAIRPEKSGGAHEIERFAGLYLQHGPVEWGIRASYLSINDQTAIEPYAAGLGDLFLSATWQALPEIRPWLDIDITTKLKLPTASDRREIGSGRSDLFLQAEGRVYLGDFLKLEPLLGRRLRAGNEATGLRDTWFSGVTGKYALMPGFRAGLTATAAQSAEVPGVPVIEAGPVLDYDFAPLWNLSVTAVRGFTRESVDKAGSLVLSRRIEW